MKIHKYERTYVLKKYAHNILGQGSPLLAIFPKVTLYVPTYKSHMNLDLHVGPITYAHQLPLSYDQFMQRKYTIKEKEKEKHIISIVVMYYSFLAAWT
jgi:hypothetical protein